MARQLLRGGCGDRRRARRDHRARCSELLRLLVTRTNASEVAESIRFSLGRALGLGLEFTAASDISRTAVAPTRQDIPNLGAIVLLRTLLNYFLEREIEQAEAKRSA